MVCSYQRYCIFYCHTTIPKHILTDLSLTCREAYSEKRLIGRILILSGKTGRVLKWVNTPDRKESYFSPLVYTLKNGTEVVVFGTGGETHGGSLYVIPLMDLYYGRIHKAIAVYTDEHKGIIVSKHLSFCYFI